jgi:hypothetical protein
MAVKIGFQANFPRMTNNKIKVMEVQKIKPIPGSIKLAKMNRLFMNIYLKLFGV